MNKNRIRRTTKNNFIKPVSVLLVLALLLELSAACFTAISYYTVRVNYLYTDGSRALDPYIATFPANEPVSITVNNPNVDGFDPMMLNEGEDDPLRLPENGTQAKTIDVNIGSLDRDVTYTVYYVAGLSHYKARYYLQNIYDDLYTTDRERNEQYQDLLGVTGSFPDYLEEVEIEGFTSLFHEPDAIAADGSTVFRLYYDRNYYSVDFDLGEGGYGVEPIYAKYQTVFRVAEPHRLGYTFLGWARTDKDSAVPGNEWHYIDENGNIISEEQATATENLFLLEGDQTIPAKNTHYKAVWGPGTTTFSVIYWFERPDSTLTHTAADFEGLTEEQIRAKMANSYSVVGAKDVYHFSTESGEAYDPQPGMVINEDTYIRTLAEKAYDEGVITSQPAVKTAKITDFFRFNLGYADPADPRNADPDPNDPNYDPDAWVYKYDTEGNVIDFPDISKGTSEDLNGNGVYYELNRSGERPDSTDDYQIVRGDGMTRFNVYFRRKTFTLKFYYAREHLTTHAFDLTNSTKKFTDYDYIGKHEDALQAIYYGPWNKDIADSKPELNPKYTDPNSPDYLPFVRENSVDYGSYRYYYYQVDAKFDAPLHNKWLIDAVCSVHKKGYGEEQLCIPGSWAVENDTNFHYMNKKENGGNGNYSVKGIYERLDKVMMLRDKTRTNPELHFLLSWTNTSINGDWNHGMEKVLHFTYKNYVELLDKELEQLQNAGYDASVLTDGEGAPYIEVREFKTVRGGQTKTLWYGLPAENVIETTDSGSQYPINNLTEKTKKVRSDQTATEMEGFQLEDYSLTGSKIELKETNTEVDWSDDTSSYRHATVKFFYRRREFTLKYRNGNRKDESHNRTVKFGAPLNAVYASGEHQGEYRYYWEHPDYFVPELNDHYSFDGWYYTPYYFRRVDPETATMPANDLTLYAKWETKKIDVVFYNSYNDYYVDTNRIVLGVDGDGNPLTAWTTNYGSYVPIARIPADHDDDESSRPQLTPIAEKASFAGWYYISNRIPHRFEPENVPVTALNAEATGDNATLRLFAEWVTKDVAKYKISYVRADDPATEVAPPTVGRAYVWKTRTFDAKPGDDLSDEYKWTAEHEAEGTNWWPTINSHSIIVQPNSEGAEFSPNEFAFTYIQKESVHYRVQYLDADTRLPINPEGHDIEKISTHASVMEDARVIPGYIANPASQVLILSASASPDPAQQKAEELRNNVITFLYFRNTLDYIYETEYYTQNIGGGYSLNAKESLTIPIAEQGDTTVAVNDLFETPVSRQLIAEGFERAPGRVAYTYVTADGSVSPAPVPVADDGVVTIVGTDKKTIRLYFDRRSYPYSYQYVDHAAARAYAQATPEQREGMWDGVLADFPNAGTAPVGATVTLNAPVNYNYTAPGAQEATAYTRLTNTDGTLSDVTVTIQPDEDGAFNLVKIFYRKDTERNLEYRMICVNNNGETDYDAVTGEPLFGRLNMNRQMVEAYDQIQDVRFFDTNDEKITEGSQEVDLHLHHYDFLGWYSSPVYNESDPAQNRLTTNPVLTKEDLQTSGELPENNVKYYALVKQKMVQMDIDFYFCDDYTKAALSGLTDSEIKAKLQAEIAAGNLRGSGEYGGKDVVFTNPSMYRNHNQIAWHKTDGYSLYIDSLDDRVYKYEFAEWWEIDEDHGGDLIPKHDWNNAGEWSADSLFNLLARNKNQHLIALYTRREVTELPYTLNYRFISRTNEEKTYVKTGVLTGDELNEKSVNTKITDAGCYELTDEFILANAPYESNFAQVLNWTDHPDYVVKDSLKGDSTAGTVDRIQTDVTAVQQKKNVFANFRTTPNGEYNTLSIPYGCNYEQSANMLAIEAPETYNGQAFAYWEVRKTQDGAVVAKSYETLFDLCMMDNYWITPVFSDAEAAAAAAEEAQPSVTLAHIDDTRNTWTDAENVVPADGTTDRLYADFEIAFENGGGSIYNAPAGAYRTGVVFELCAKLSKGEVFDPDRDYGMTSDPDNLKAAVLANAKSYVCDPSEPAKTRSLQISEIPQSALTNHDRVQYGKAYRNTYKFVDSEKTYINAGYLLKATAYLVKGGEVLLSNSVYVCLAAEAQKELAVDCGIVLTGNGG